MTYENAVRPEAGSRGAEMMPLIRELYPVCRSITGDGVRQTLRRLACEIPLQIREIPSGTAIYDWTVPQEWNIRDAWIRNLRGEKVVDFGAHSLHVVGYSRPLHRRVPLEELRQHLHTLPDHPDWIPYRTSYYADDWGFCVTQRQYQALNEPEYEVCIDSELRDGSMTYGECLLRGDTDAEVLISAHVCHPSLANDNLSGIAVATRLAREIASRRHRYSYRFLFAPVTIGAIAWLARNEHRVGAIAHGLVLAGVGDAGPLTYKRSRRGDAEIDRAVACVLRHDGRPHAINDFSVYGYDERQYCSPGIDLPVGCLMRSPWGTYPEYHTSGDSPDFLSEASLEASLEACLAVVGVLEGNAAYVNLKPKGEVQLSRYGLYRRIDAADAADTQLALLWVLNYSDGRHTLLDIAERSNLPFTAVRRAADRLLEAQLLSERITTGEPRRASVETASSEVVA